MSDTYLAWDNLVNSAALTASASSLPVSNLLDPTGAPSMAWQSAAGAVTAGSAWIQVAFAQRTAVRVMGVFRTNLTHSARVTFNLYQTGNPSPVSGATLAGPQPGYGQVVRVLSQDIAADRLNITFDDPSNTDGFINVPLVHVGRAWNPIGAPAWTSSMGRDVSVNEQTSLGGQEYPDIYWHRRRWEVRWATLRPSELAVISGIDIVGASGGNVLFVPDATSDYLQIEAVYGRLKATGDIGYPYQAASRRSWSGRITERL